MKNIGTKIMDKQDEIWTIDMWDIRHQVYARIAEIACWEQMDRETAAQQREYAYACIQQLWESYRDSYCMSILLHPFEKECVAAGEFCFTDEHIPCRVLNQIDRELIQKGYLYALRVPEQSEESDAPQSLLQQYYVEAFQVACMDVARAWIQDYLQKKHSAETPCVCSPSFGPGYYGMKLEDVPRLVKILDAKRIGIEWEQGSMNPQMSLIGVYLISKDELLQPESDCEDCIGGRAGCDFCDKRIIHTTEIF